MNNMLKTTLLLGGLTGLLLLIGQLFGGRLVAPWTAWLDSEKFGAVVDRFSSLGAEVIAGCHTPVLRGPRVAEAFDLLHGLPGVEPWQEFTQTDLDGWMAAAEQAAASGPS